MSGATAPAAGGTLVLAEPYGGWTATLNGRALRPVGTPVDGWAQGFVLPPGGGALSITRTTWPGRRRCWPELVVVLAVCMLALPGKRADPAEEAEAMAALREARTGRRAARPLAGGSLDAGPAPTGAGAAPPCRRSATRTDQIAPAARPDGRAAGRPGANAPAWVEIAGLT